MAQGHTRTFNHPEAYGAAFGEIRVDLVITGTGDFSAKLTHLKLHHMDVFWCRETLARTAYISLPNDRTVLSFPIGFTSLTVGGASLRSNEMMLHARADRLHQRTKPGSQWGLVSLEAQEFAHCAGALNEGALPSLPTSRTYRPRRNDASLFRSLFRHVGRLAESARNLMANPAVSRAFEQEMLHALSLCLMGTHEADATARVRQQHAAIMVRFEEASRRYIDQKINVPALCEEIGVAERTLRMCCSTTLGMSPTRYLLLQRLNRARAALRRADPSQSTVSDIALHNNFVDLGRFAVTYRTIFGESPSTTLQRKWQE